mmetsp:Transcript_26107/g.56079  ORF Transcript_26107/g.56079 Transcript_26107/m.56079 type:complete len:150 (-) Transcript_26107:243-692(-)
MLQTVFFLIPGALDSDIFYSAAVVVIFIFIMRCSPLQGLQNGCLGIDFEAVSHSTALARDEHPVKFVLLVLNWRGLGDCQCVIWVALVLLFLLLVSDLNLFKLLGMKGPPWVYYSSCYCASQEDATGIGVRVWKIQQVDNGNGDAFMFC